MLLAGLGGLGAEVAKNLILAGVKGLTLLDHEQVSMFIQYTHEHILRCSLSSHHSGLGLQFEPRNLYFQLSAKSLIYS